MMESDAEIIKYLDHQIELEMDMLPSEKALAPIFAYSKNFERRMRPLFRKANRQTSQSLDERQSRPTTSKRLVLAAIILAVLATLTGVAIANESVRGFFVEVFEDFTDLVFTASTDDADPSGQPTIDPDDLMLPEGYSEILRDENSVYQEVIYANASGDEFSFYKTAADGMSMSIYPGDSETESIMIRGAEGLYYSNHGIQNLIWVENGYFLHIYGRVSKSDILHMFK